MIDYQLLHWKVTGIASRKPRSYPHGGSRHEAVRLAERHTPFGKMAPPAPGLFALDPSEWSKPKPVQKSSEARFLARLYSSKELLHVDGAGVGAVASGPQLTDASGSRMPAQGIDESCGVEENPAQMNLSADSAAISPPL